MRTCGYSESLRYSKEVISPNCVIDYRIGETLYDCMLQTAYMNVVPIKLKKNEYNRFVLETVHKGILIKVVDCEKNCLNESLIYPIKYLTCLKAMDAHGREYANDIIFNIVNYIDFLEQYNIKLHYDKLIVIANVPYLDNAYWNGSYLTFGNGTQMHHPLTSSTIVGHELTHALIQTINDLEYRGHSGALNESFADIFGVMYEDYIMNKYKHTIGWVIGDECNFTLRNMSNPHEHGQPKVMYDRYYCNPKSEEDSGGVHVNSGIPNHLFYMFSIYVGKPRAFEIFLRTLYALHKWSDFIHFKIVLISNLNESEKNMTSLIDSKIF